jgi:curved DNA-binding protein CbpA
MTRQCLRLLLAHRPGVWAPSAKRRMATTSAKNPFRVLGLPPNVSFPTVQKKFLKLAMKHHPDTKSSIESNAKSDTETFVLIRSAFEQLRKEHNRQQLEPRDDKYDAEDVFTEEDFLDWFHQLTGVRLTSEQRREMVHLYWKEYQPNGGRQSHDHSWDLARRLVSLQDVFFRNREKPRTTRVQDDSNNNSEKEETTIRSSNSINLRRKRPARRS